MPFCRPGAGYLNDNGARGRLGGKMFLLSAWAAAGSCRPAAILASPINILPPELEGLRDNLVFMLVWTLPDYQLSLITQALPSLLGNRPDSTEGLLLLLPALPLPSPLISFWIARWTACSLCCPPCAPTI